MWFSPELRTMSVVPRWSIVWTLTRDVLSNHSFFVAVYADQIAAMIEWKGPHGALLVSALLHDADETVTGDIVAPIKHEIIDKTRAKAFVSGKMRERLPYVEHRLSGIDTRWRGDIYKIVKAADRLDAVLFLVIEQRLGNSVIAPRIPETLEALKEAWRKLPCSPPGQSLDDLYFQTVWPAIESHRITGGYGL